MSPNRAEPESAQCGPGAPAIGCARGMGGTGGIGPGCGSVSDPLETAPDFSGEDDRPEQRPSRYRGLPVVFLAGADGVARPASYLMTDADVADLFRLRDSATRFPDKTIARYRRLGLRSVRVGRRRWYALPDVLDFLDRQQSRLRGRG